MPAKKSKSKKKTTSRSRVATSPLKRVRQNPVAMWLVIIGLAVLGVAFVMLINAASPLSYTPAGQATSALDESGKTIPKTNYAIPAGAIFMSPTGSDSNDGKTVNTPVKTLTKAISTVPSNGTIVTMAGVYRDAHIPIANGKYVTTTKSFTLQAYPGAQVWFDGADVVTNWVANNNNTWSVDWSTPNFCHLYNYNTAGGYYDQIWPWNGTPSQKGPCAHADMIKDPNTDPDPQMVFINDAALKQVRSLSAVGAGSFYYDVAARKVIIGTDPAGKTVEVTKRPSALMLQGGSGGNIIRGIGFRKYATNEQFEGSYTGGAIMVNVPNSRIENVVFDRNAGGALVVYNPSGAVITKTIFANNGFSGVSSNGTSHKTTTPNNFTVEANVFNNNNTALFGPGCGESCSAAAIKVAHMKGMSFKNNIVENQQGVAAGFWCDLKCEEVTVANNVFVNNGGHGVFYEVSNTGIIASNVIINNKRYGLKVSAANTKIYNNTVVGNSGGGALIYDDNRTPGVGGWDDISPNSTALEFVNNLMYENKTAEVDSWRVGDSPNTGPNTFYTQYDYNIYYHSNAAVPLAHWIDPKGSESKYSNISSFRSARNWEKSGLELTSYANPFANSAGQDYRLKADSLANLQKGTKLPADVAQAIGVPAGTVPVRGAIFDSSVSVTPTPTPTATVRPTNTITPTPTTIKTITPTPPLPPPSSQLGVVSKPTLGLSYDWLRGVYNIQLSWNQPSGATSNISYDIIRNDTVIASTATLNYSDYSVQPTTAYTYKVQARDTGRTSISPTATGTINCFWIFCGLWQ